MQFKNPLLEFQDQVMSQRQKESRNSLTPRKHKFMTSEVLSFVDTSPRTKRLATVQSYAVTSQSGDQDSPSVQQNNHENNETTNKVMDTEQVHRMFSFGQEADLDSNDSQTKQPNEKMEFNNKSVNSSVSLKIDMVDRQMRMQSKQNPQSIVHIHLI